MKVWSAWLDADKSVRFWTNWLAPNVLGDDLAEGHKAMGLDALREQEALDWSEALIGDANHATG